MDGRDTDRDGSDSGGDDGGDGCSDGDGKKEREEQKEQEEPKEFYEDGRRETKGKWKGKDDVESREAGIKKGREERKDWTTEERKELRDLEGGRQGGIFQLALRPHVDGDAHLRRRREGKEEKTNGRRTVGQGDGRKEDQRGQRGDGDGDNDNGDDDDSDGDDKGNDEYDIYINIYFLVSIARSGVISNIQNILRTTLLVWKERFQGRGSSIIKERDNTKRRKHGKGED